MDAAQFLPTEPSSEVTQIHEGDYKDADGLWHCGVCGKARQKKINSPYFHKTVWCICDCRARELEERRRKEEYEEEMHRVQRDDYRGKPKNRRKKHRTCILWSMWNRKEFHSSLYCK